MKYRILGRTGFKIGEIGMGLEHLLDKEAQVVANTIRAAIDGGVNCFDCHMGHDYDEKSITYVSYEKLGKAIRGIREKLHLSHISHWMTRAPQDAAPRFEAYLQALDTDYADVFMIQFCDKAADYEQVTAEGGILEYAKQLKAQGKGRAIGIATHSSAIAYKAIDNGAFDVIMYPVNPAFDVVTDEEQYKSEDLMTLWNAAHDFKADGKAGAQPRKSVYSECERKNIGLIAMKPFAGGFIFGVEGDAGFTPVNLISYALSQSGVSAVVPGCTKPSEIEEILTYNTATDEMRDYSGAVAKSRWSVRENCLYCNHCLPCAANINIGQVNRLLDALAYDGDSDAGDVRTRYDALPVKASACVECGVCEERCPFKVKVIERMKNAVQVFEG